jgi:hypothetical protein
MRKLLLLALVVLAGCHPVQDSSQVDAAVDKFHERLAAGDNDSIYREAGPEYQRSIDIETNQRFLARVERKLGTPGKGSRLNYNVKYSSGEAVVNTQYDVKFTNGDATESFIWRVKDGRATLLGYTVDSPVLQAK